MLGTIAAEPAAAKFAAGIVGTTCLDDEVLFGSKAASFNVVASLRGSRGAAGLLGVWM